MEGLLIRVLEAVVDKEGNITDVEVNYGMTFEEQMLFYSDKYGHLRTGIRK